jgi:hypothetical protein
LYFIEQDAVAAMEALQAQNAAKAREMQMASAADKTTVTDADTTFAANMTTATGVSSNKSGIPGKKKAGKPKMTAKEKKERGVRVLFVSLLGPAAHFATADRNRENYCLPTFGISGQRSCMLAHASLLLITHRLETDPAS